ncbi:6026_t:CDS:1, partial [Rhizophagus irregularis]
MDIHMPYGSNAVESENVTMYTWLEQSWIQFVVAHVGSFLECGIQ